MKARGNRLVNTKNKGVLNSLNLYLFDEQFPTSENVQASFQTECPPDSKVKLDAPFGLSKLKEANKEKKKPTTNVQT